MALAVCYLTMVRSAAPSGPFEQYAETAPLIACLFIHSLLGDDGARQGNWRVVACPFPMGGDQPCRVYHIGTRLRLPVPDFVSAAPRQHDKCCMEVVSVAAVGAQHMRYSKYGSGGPALVGPANCPISHSSIDRNGGYARRPRRAK